MGHLEAVQHRSCVPPAASIHWRGERGRCGLAEHSAFAIYTFHLGSGEWVVCISAESILMGAYPQLRGQMLTSSRSDGIHSFLEVVVPVWDSTMSTAGDGNLRGRQALPFTIPFPTEFPDSFAVRTKRKTREDEGDPLAMFPTPQTVCQRGINANVQYEVTLKITTSGLFKSKHRCVK